MVADRADSFDIDIVISVGLEGGLIHERLTEKKKANIHHFKQNEDVNNWLANNAKEGDTVLIKGSRGFNHRLLGSFWQCLAADLDFITTFNIQVGVQRKER